MRNFTALLLVFAILSSWTQRKTKGKENLIVATGQMPDIVMDNKGNLHLIYGSGDSIMYTFSADQGRSFSSPQLVSILPELAASHTRGPQIAATTKGLTVLACNSPGDIFSFFKANGGKWRNTGKVNDRDTTAKENLVALSGDGDHAFAVWLDLRGNKHNKIFGSGSYDGGKSWSKNRLIYESPDSTVCECCKPSVVVNGSNVHVMFRNWLDGNRDMYLVTSTNSGKTFGKAGKIGNGSWRLNGCPMDGGGLVVNEKGSVNTVWRREGKVYAASPGQPEIEIGAGRGCTLTASKGKTAYAWTENGSVIFFNSKRQKNIVGEGSQPVLQALSNEHVICVWENNHRIHASVIEL